MSIVRNSESFHHSLVFSTVAIQFGGFSRILRVLVDEERSAQDLRRPYACVKVATPAYLFAP
ncbi:hypothetical protein J6590_089419 [Homalodisca vitripennis]|nr:hypothetical protein J6590_089419 [Homalodisca vitripennis]